MSGGVHGWIACVLAPHFAAETVRRALKVSAAMPLALVGPKKVVAGCARAAQAGVQPGMTARQAAYLCPDARQVPFDEAAIRQTAHALLGTLAAYGDAVEVEGLPQGEGSAKHRKPLAPALLARQAAAFYVNLGRLNAADAARMAEDMGAAFARESGVRASVGLARTKFTAFAAATVAAGDAPAIVPPADEAAFLSLLPTALLPAEPEMARRLRVLGLTTLGALASLPPGAALAQFGKAGAALGLMARGVDHRRVPYFSREGPLRATCQFETALGARDMLESSLRGVVNRLAARLRKRGAMVRTVSLTLKLEDGATAARRATPREPVSSGSRLADIVLRLFGQMKIAGPVSSYEIVLDDLIPCAGQQLPLLPDESAEASALQAALETLAARRDAPRCLRPIAARRSARRIEQRYRFEAA